MKTGGMSLNNTKGVVEVHPGIFVMQYTGLKDKSGKEIYEGDILDTTGKLDDYETYAIVVWDNDQSAWGYEEQDGEDTVCGTLFDLAAGDFEITGNIYETPELLTN
jgi:uncharacterized phage protein (TIGR01671 family)